MRATTRDTTSRYGRLAAAAALSGCLVALVLLAWPGGSQSTLRATFDEAIQVVGGQEVRIAGRKVGEVRSVEEIDGDAVVEMTIDNGEWPLRRGTTARLRLGSVSGYAARFVELRPGPAGAPALADGAVLSRAATVTPVEFDQLFNAFDARTRRDLRGLLDNAAATVGPRGAELGRSLEQGSAGLGEIADLFADLGARPEALRTLVRAGARTSSALGAREAELRALLDGAAGTIDELASRARAQQQALDRFPGALSAGRATLGRLEGSLAGLRGLVSDLAPGARSLRSVAAPLRRTTATLLDVAPRASRTLEIGRRNAPAIDRLLRAGTPFLPKAGAVLDGLAPAVACIRPYGPEIAGAATTWTGFTGVDMEGGHSRANLTQLPPGAGAGTVLDSKQITSTYRDRIFYAMPRPPGLDAGQPWFLPECGAGRDALDPSKDPERRSAG